MSREDLRGGQRVRSYGLQSIYLSSEAILFEFLTTDDEGSIIPFKFAPFSAYVAECSAENGATVQFESQAYRHRAEQVHGGVLRGGIHVNVANVPA